VHSACGAISVTTPFTSFTGMLSFVRSIGSIVCWNMGSGPAGSSMVLLATVPARAKSCCSYSSKPSALAVAVACVSAVALTSKFHYQALE
jgi:hypothetical protein